MSTHPIERSRLDVPPTGRANRHRRSVTIARRVGLTVALSGAVLGAAASSAQAVGNGVLASAEPVVYPGTTVPIDSWRLHGRGSVASATQIAPRWVLATEHAPPHEEGITTLDRGASLGIGKSVSPMLNATTRAADISLTLLKDPLPAPASGWPRLLRDAPGALVDGLPGQVLFAGGGGGGNVGNFGTPNLGWATPAGLRAPGLLNLQAVSGDSGSSAYWYTSPTASPVITAISSSPFFAETSAWTINDQTTLWEQFSGPIVGSSATNVGDWLREQIAKHPEATPPTWVSLNDVTPFSGLRPPTPTAFQVSSVTPTSVSLSWKHSTDTRVARTGYRVSRAGIAVNLPANATSYTANGLTAGNAYEYTLRATNANGDSPTAPGTPVTASYTVRPNPGALRGLTVTAEPAYKTDSGVRVLDYCFLAKWDAPTPVAGAPITRYEATIDGVASLLTPGSSEYGMRPGEDGKYFVRRCGVAPTSSHSVSVRALSDLSVGPTSSGSTTVPSGAAIGTVIPGVSGLATVPRRSIRNGAVDYCTTTSWQAPAVVDGAPVTGYGIRLVVIGSRGTSMTPREVLATTRSHTTCGLQSSARYQVYVAALYSNVAPSEGGATVEKMVLLTTPTGPDAGSSLPGPKDLEMTPRLTRDLNGKVDYCVQIRWSAPDPVVGFSVLDYDLSLNSADLSFSKALTALTATAGVMSRDICGLKPTTTYTVWAAARYQVTDTMTTFAFADPVDATTPAGAAPGTLWPAPTAITATVVTVGTGLCADIAWQAPTLAPGMAAPTTYGVSTFGGTFSVGSDELPGTVRTTRVCDLPRGKRLTSNVYASFGDATVTKGSVTFTTPA